MRPAIAAALTAGADAGQQHDPPAAAARLAGSSGADGRRSWHVKPRRFARLVEGFVVACHRPVSGQSARTPEKSRGACWVPRAPLARARPYRLACPHRACCPHALLCPPLRSFPYSCPLRAPVNSRCVLFSGFYFTTPTSQLVHRSGEAARPSLFRTPRKLWAARRHRAR
jgi:hypothetical protein